MSWTWWVYRANCERIEARWSCAFPEELDAGFTRSVPAHVARWDR